MRMVTTLLPLLLACGCASSLRSFDADGHKLKGVPVRSPILAEVTRVSEYTVVTKDNVNKEYCRSDTTITLELLPIGQLYYLNFNPATFGKAEFKVELTDAGLLKAVALNSDPRTAETTKEIGSLLGTLLPYRGAAMEASAKSIAGNETAQELRDRYCLRSRIRVIGFKESNLGP